MSGSPDPSAATAVEPSASGMVDLVVEPSDVIVAFGHFPDGLSDAQIAAGLRIETIPAANAAPLLEPGTKHWNADGTITVTPPPAPATISAQRFEAAEDAERLAIVAERAATDPAFAALAELTLGTKGVQS